MRVVWLWENSIHVGVGGEEEGAVLEAAPAQGDRGDCRQEIGSLVLERLCNCALLDNGA
jgi:hypothetical protein